jgi:CRP-like cAMP-binding protein
MQMTLAQREQAFADAAGRSATPSVARPAPRDALDLLEQFGTTVSVLRDRQIYDQGDQANYCYKILNGCARTVHLTEDGCRQIGEFLLAGDLLGFDVLETYDFAAEAVTNVVLRRYPRQTIDKLADSNIALSRRLRDVALVGLRRTHTRMLLGRRSALERIAGFFLEIAERLPAIRPHVLELPMTRADIGDHLGLTIETVCRVLALLRRDGTVTIDPTDRSRVTIRNDIALRQTASGLRTERSALAASARAGGSNQVLRFISPDER